MFQTLLQPKQKKDLPVHSDKINISKKVKNMVNVPSTGTPSKILWSTLKAYNNSGNSGGRLFYNLNNTNVVQREFDDSIASEYDNLEVYRVLMKIINKHPELKPLLTEISIKNIHDYYKAALNKEGKYRSITKYTERQIAEQLTTGQLGREMISAFLSQKRENGFSKDTSILQKTMCECWYFHVTENDNAESIYSKGLSPWMGGKEEGISTKGIEKKDLQDQYNKWSKGFTFITDDFKEANKYREKLKNGVILDIFVSSALRQHLYIDPDSHGLKCNQEIYAVGNGKELNRTAVGFLSALSEKRGQTVTEEEVQEAYTSLCHSRKTG